MTDKPPQRFAPKKTWATVSKEAPTEPYKPGEWMNSHWHIEQQKPRLKSLFFGGSTNWDANNRAQFAAKIYEHIAGIQRAFANGMLDGVYTEEYIRKSVGDLLAKLEDHPVSEVADEHFTTGVLITVRRERNEDQLHPDASPTLSAFATTEEEAFHQLLLISGLDAMEIKMHDLSMDSLMGPAGLIDKLKELTGDSYDMEMGEIALPLLESVKDVLTHTEPVTPQSPFFTP